MNLEYIFSIAPILLKASLKTLELTTFSVACGSLLGIFAALMKLQKNKVIYIIGYFYTWIFRGTPLILQIIFIYYGLPSFGIELSSMQGALIALSLNSGAYMAEIIRGGILSIDKGQFEASKALGFTYSQTMRRIILPQTVRVIIPSVGNEFITMLKDTALVSVIAMSELMRTAQTMYAAKFSIEPFVVASVIYLLLTSVFTTAFSAMEKKLSSY
jgi:polar amino acid transport system permease protein